MSFYGHLQDISYPVEYPMPLISFTNDEKVAQIKQTKLIDDSDIHYPGLTPPTLAAMNSLNISPITSYHEDLSSLLISSNTTPAPIIQYSNLSLQSHRVWR